MHAQPRQNAPLPSQSGQEGSHGRSSQEVGTSGVSQFQTEQQQNGGDQNYQFYKEYCRLYYANIILTNRLQQLLNEKKDLQFKLNRLESNKRAHEDALGITFDIADEKRKRHRRTATEISRHYPCPIEDCPKSYGSEGSLNQHLKLKHQEYYKQQVQESNQNQTLQHLHNMAQSTNSDLKLKQGGAGDGQTQQLGAVDEEEQSGDESADSDNYNPHRSNKRTLLTRRNDDNRRDNQSDDDQSSGSNGDNQESGEDEQQPHRGAARR